MKVTNSFFFIFIILILFSSAASAALPFVDYYLLPDGDNIDSTNYTKTDAHNEIENHAVKLTTQYNEGIIQKIDALPVKCTYNFTFYDYNTGDTGDIRIYINSSSTDHTGPYFRMQDYQAFTRLNGSVAPTGGTGERQLANQSTVCISKNVSYVNIWIDDYYVGGWTTAIGSGGYFGMATGGNGDKVGFTDLVISEQFIAYGSGGGGGTPADTDVYYVSPTGDDSNNGTTTVTPKKTLNNILGNVTGNITIYMMSGTYEDITCVPTQYLDPNITVRSYNLSNHALLTSSTRNSGETNAAKTFNGENGYFCNVNRNDNFTVESIDFSWYGGGFEQVGNNPRFLNCTFSNFYGLNQDNSQSVQTIEINANSYGRFAPGNPWLKTVEIRNCTVTNPVLSGSGSPNVFQFSGDETSGRLCKVKYYDNTITGELYHQGLNIQPMSYEYTDGAGFGFEFDIRNNTVNNISYKETFGTTVMKGSARNYTISNEYYSDVRAGIQGKFYDSVFTNISTGVLYGHPETLGSGYTIWLDKETDDYSTTPKSTNVTISNCTSLGEGSDLGVLMDYGYDIEFDYCDYWQYRLAEGDFTVINQNVSERQTYIVDTLSKAKSTTRASTGFENGRIFMENGTQDIIANTTGTWLNIGVEDVDITALNYSAVPTTTATISNVSVTGFNINPAASENITFTELATGNSTNSSMIPGDTYVAFSSLDFTPDEGVTDLYFYGVAGTSYLNYPTKMTFSSGVWTESFPNDGKQTTTPETITGVEIHP